VTEVRTSRSLLFLLLRLCSPLALLSSRSLLHVHLLARHLAKGKAPLLLSFPTPLFFLAALPLPSRRCIILFFSLPLVAIEDLLEGCNTHVDIPPPSIASPSPFNKIDKVPSLSFTPRCPPLSGHVPSGECASFEGQYAHRVSARCLFSPIYVFQAFPPSFPGALECQPSASFSRS